MPRYPIQHSDDILKILSSMPDDATIEVINDSTAFDPANIDVVAERVLRIIVQDKQGTIA